VELKVAVVRRFRPATGVAAVHLTQLGQSGKFRMCGVFAVKFDKFENWLDRAAMDPQSGKPGTLVARFPETTVRAMEAQILQSPGPHNLGPARSELTDSTFAVGSHRL